MIEKCPQSGYWFIRGTGILVDDVKELWESGFTVDQIRDSFVCLIVRCPECDVELATRSYREDSRGVRHRQKFCRDCEARVDVASEEQIREAIEFVVPRASS